MAADGKGTTRTQRMKQFQVFFVLPAGANRGLGWTGDAPPNLAANFRQGSDAPNLHGLSSVTLQMVLPSVPESLYHGRQHLGVHMGQGLYVPQG